MALLDFTRRRADLDNAVRSGDRTLNVFFVILLIAYALGSLYFYGRTDPINAAIGSSSSSTVTQPVTAPASPNASPTQPAPSPNPRRDNRDD